MATHRDERDPGKFVTIRMQVCARTVVQRLRSIIAVPFLNPSKPLYQGAEGPLRFLWYRALILLDSILLVGL